MRAELRIPPLPDRPHAPAYTPEAIAMRERFVRAAAEAWSRAGDDGFAAAARRHERGCHPVRA